MLLVSVPVRVLTGDTPVGDMTGVASPEKPTSSKKKSERKEYKQEYKQLSSIMGVMNNLRKQVGARATTPSLCEMDGVTPAFKMLRVLLRGPSVTSPWWSRGNTSPPTGWCWPPPATSSV